jgi:hypothetical protein
MALEGSLRDMSLVDLFRIFQLGQKTGMLMLVGTQERGIISIAAGRLVDAAIIRSADRQVTAVREDAILQLLQWDDAVFAFRHDPNLLKRPVRITKDSTWLMLEGLRRRTRPLPLQPHQVLTLDTPLELAPLPDNDEWNAGLAMDQVRLLNLIGVYRTLRVFCQRTGIIPDTAIRLASELVIVGLVEIGTIDVPVISGTPKPVGQPDTAILQAQPVLASRVVAGPTRRALPTKRALFDAVVRRIREL